MPKKIHGFTLTEYQQFLDDSRKELAELEEWMSTWGDNSKQVPFEIRKYAECLKRAHRAAGANRV